MGGMENLGVDAVSAVEVGL